MKKRQSIRKAIILISFLLFPVTVYFFSPALILQGASEGVVAGSMITFALLFLFAFIFGRAFCSWICPSGGLQECARLANDKPFRHPRWNWIKAAIWVPWVLLIVILAIKAGGFHAIKPLYQMEDGIPLSESQGVVIYFGVLFFILAPALLAGRRSFCHMFCWISPFMIIGSWIRNRLRLPGLRLTSNKDDCIHCGACDKKCPMSLQVEKLVSKGNMRNAECILCGECVDVCPKKVIHFSWKDEKR
jgi:ferredoxin-type protein NapH